MAQRASRTCGILLHPTSLPGPHGIGTLGAQAKAFVDFLHAAGQSLWQILPLGPTGYGDSPYSALSSFAGNPLMIDLDLLAAEGLVDPAELSASPRSTDRVDFGAVVQHKVPLLQRAAQRFLLHASPERKQAFELFCYEQRAWLEDWALFSIVKSMHEGKSIHQWEEALKRRDPAALDRVRHDFAEQIAISNVVQFFFYDQWNAVRAYAHSKGISILGDMPIFVAYDSDAVWVSPRVFKIDQNLVPHVVAGVPPDYFAADGQLWGNPLYDWPYLAETGYAWWLARLRHALNQADIVRLDHFRGFETAWEVPADHPTARHGTWVKGPGDDFFNALREHFGGLPFVAEDLGLITDEVLALRDRHGLPGMFVLQFGFNPGEIRSHAPHRCIRNSVVYTGTHDNDTTVGWFDALPQASRRLVQSYLGTSGATIHWSMIRAAYQTAANTVVVPVQDVLGLGSEARMNVPGLLGSNWSFRLVEQPHAAAAAHLRELAELFERLPS